MTAVLAPWAEVCTLFTSWDAIALAMEVFALLAWGDCLTQGTWLGVTSTGSWWQLGPGAGAGKLSGLDALMRL